MKKHFLTLLMILILVGCKNNKKEEGIDVKELNILSSKNGYAFVDKKENGYFIYKKLENYNYEKVCKLPIRNNWLNDDENLKFEYIYIDNYLYLLNNVKDDITKYNLTNCENEKGMGIQGYHAMVSNTSSTMIGADDKYIYYKKEIDKVNNWHFYKVDLNLENSEEIKENAIPSNLNKKISN